MAYREICRRLVRQAVARGWPGNSGAARRIAVAGLPRSGTSWIAKAVSLARGVSYYFEPELELGRPYMYVYLPPEEADDRLKAQIERSFRGRVVGEYTIAEQGLSELLARPVAGTVLVKWVRLSLSLDWIANQFPGLAVVQAIRHPVPQFLSWRQRAWDPGYNLALLLAQPKLMEGPLREFADVMRGAETFWEKAGALWAGVAYMQWRAHRRGWWLLEHEWLCLDAAERMAWLVAALGLDWNERISEFLSPDRARQSGPGYGARRDSRAEIHKWEKDLSGAERRELEAVLRPFALPFYRDLDPEALLGPELGAMPHAR